MENIKPVKSDFEFKNQNFDGIRILLEVDYQSKSYMVLVYKDNKVENLQDLIGNFSADFDLALISTVKSAIEFAKGELSK